MQIKDAKGDDYTVVRQTTWRRGSITGQMYEHSDFYYLNTNLNNTPGSLTLQDGDGKFKGYLTPFDSQERVITKSDENFANTFEKGMWQGAVILTTGGIGSSQIFGTHLLGRIGAGIAEDFAGQMLTNGMEVNKINLTAAVGNIIPGIKGNLATLFLKNAVSNTFSYSSKEGYTGVGSEIFSWNDDVTSTAIGTALDFGLEKLRGLSASVNRQQYTRFQSLSYKPKYALKFNQMKFKLNINIMLKNAASTFGTGIIQNAASNVSQQAATLSVACGYGVVIVSPPLVDI